MQPEINVGTIGHVDHGKTTLVWALSGKWADEHSEELKRGITIKLGYADVELRKCEKCNYYTTYKKCPKCGGETKLIRKISFVDAPGHESLMATMLSGAAIMDYALLIIAANEKCPRPQTREHLTAAKIIGIKNIIVAQNKIDLVSKERALENYKEIKNFLEEFGYKDVPIIPISAQHKANIDVLIEAMVKFWPPPKRDPNKDPIFLVARSFDINLPGTKPENLKGGVLGGSLKQGKLKVGDEIEIRPGIIRKEGMRFVSQPLFTEIVSINSGGEFLDELRPGGSAGLGTKLDPLLTKSDRLVGNVVGKPGKLPPILNSLTLDVHLLEKVVGLDQETKIEDLKVNEKLVINAWSAKTIGIIRSKRENIIDLDLRLPVCIQKGEKVAISKEIMGRWRLVGYGIVL